MDCSKVKLDFEEPLFEVILVDEFDVINTSNNSASRSFRLFSADEAEDDDFLAE